MRTHNISLSFRRQTHTMRWIRPIFVNSTPNVKADPTLTLFSFHFLIHPFWKVALRMHNSKHQTDKRKKSRSFNAVILKHIICLHIATSHRHLPCDITPSYLSLSHFLFLSPPSIPLLCVCVCVCLYCCPQNSVGAACMESD